MRGALFCVLGAVAVVLLGCGGGGGNSSTGDPFPVASIRQLQIGDEVSFNIIEGSFEAGGQSYSAYAEIDSTTCASGIAPKHGGRALKMVMDIRITLSNAGDMTWVNGEHTTYLEQTSDGTIYEVGEEGADGQILLTSWVHNPILYKSPMAVGEEHAYTATYSDGTSIGHSIEVFDCLNDDYEIEQKITPSDGSSVYTVFTPTYGYPQFLNVEWKLPEGTLKGCLRRGNSTLLPPPPGA